MVYSPDLSKISPRFAWVLPTPFPQGFRQSPFHTWPKVFCLDVEWYFHPNLGDVPWQQKACGVKRSFSQTWGSPLGVVTPANRYLVFDYAGGSGVFPQARRKGLPAKANSLLRFNSNLC